MKESLINGSVDLIVAILGALLVGGGGYFIRGAIENKKEKKRTKESTEKMIKQHIDTLSGKTLSIRHDIGIYNHFYNFVNDFLTEEGFQESSFYTNSIETKKMVEQRLLENLEVISTIDTSNYDREYEEIKDIIDRYKNTSNNLRRILTLKSDDNQKVSLLNKSESEFAEHYSSLMENSSFLYK